MGRAGGVLLAFLSGAGVFHGVLTQQDLATIPGFNNIWGMNNIGGILGHPYCESDGRVGECYNGVECLARGGWPGVDCPQGWSETLSTGVCCVLSTSATQSSSSASVGYFTNAEWPSAGNGTQHYSHKVTPLDGVCWIRFDLLTLELPEMGGNCVHDRVVVVGGSEPSGSLCGERSGEVTLVEATDNVEIHVMVQSEKWRWNIGITQILCSEVEKMAQAAAVNVDCGAKNPSERNHIGQLGPDGERKKPQSAADIPGLKRKKARKVFKQLEKLPVLTKLEKSKLKIYKPSFTRQELDYEKANFNPLGRMRSMLDWRQKGRILYGNETDVNEYPWQVSMWIDRSHFCGGTLISEDWVATAAHCVDLQYRRHFKRITVSLGDHNVKVYDDARNTFRKLRRIVRSPQYDNNFINGDMALLQLEDKVTFSDTIRPACLPDPTETFAYEQGVITGWGYTDKTKVLKPRPLTSDVLREAEIFILPQDLCHKYSPFPITDRMVCTFKGPLGVESTCQGDSGGPLVVNRGENKHVLVGATSFGVSTCEGPYPAMFTRITSHLDFIHAAMVPAPMEYMADYITPHDPGNFPATDNGALFDIF